MSVPSFLPAHPALLAPFSQSYQLSEASLASLSELKTGEGHSPLFIFLSLLFISHFGYLFITSWSQKG